MKSKVFILNPSSATSYEKTGSVHATKGDIHTYVFTIPILEAYAVEYFTLQYGALSVFPLSNDRLEGNSLKISAGYSLNNLDCKLVIFYQGIRDYRLLFPRVAPETLQLRLGEFYKEAEIAFNSGSWLSFVLMCGAIFEGLLFFKTNQNKSFKDLIQTAFENNMIEDQSMKIMNRTREYRNLVHANKHSLPYVSRADAMDTRIVLDKLILEA